MSQKDFREPWSAIDRTVQDFGGTILAVCPATAYDPAGPLGEAQAAERARRIAACVTALADVPTEQLEDGPLLAAAKELHEACKLVLLCLSPDIRDLTPIEEQTRQRVLEAVRQAEGDQGVKACP